MASDYKSKESKVLTKRERLFAEGIAMKGLDRVEAYSVAFDEDMGDEAQQNRLAGKAERLFYKPHVRRYYDGLMEQVRAAETSQAVWTKEVATEKLMFVIDKALKELETERITMARLTAVTAPVKELNSMNGLNAPTKLDMDGGMVFNIIEDQLPE